MSQNIKNHKRFEQLEDSFCPMEDKKNKMCKTCDNKKTIYDSKLEEQIPCPTCCDSDSLFFIDP